MHLNGIFAFCDFYFVLTISMMRRIFYEAVWKKLAACALACLLMLSCAACGSAKSPLDPHKPTTITI